MVFSITALTSRISARDKSAWGVHKYSHLRDQQTLYTPRDADWLENQTSGVLSQAALKLFDPPIRHHRALRGPVLVWIRFSSFLFIKGVDVLDRIDRPRTVVACFCIQAVVWVRILFALSRIGCDKTVDIIDDTKSLNLAEEEMKHVVALKPKAWSSCSKRHSKN